jgi:hypothetical protein
MIDALRQSGWAAIDGAKTTSDMMDVARAIGRPLRAPTGELVRRLMPIDAHLARANSLSSRFGRGSFPFHTDTAFWPIPSRYLVMRVIGDQRRATTLLDFEDVLGKLSSRARNDVQRSVWRARRDGCAMYCSMSFAAGTLRGWRFDADVMEPANASAKRAHEDVAHVIRESNPTATISWETTTCVVIDNWRLLHARGSAPPKEKARILFRIYAG